MVNKATGDAALANSAMVLSSGSHSVVPHMPASAPSKMDQGMGLRNTPFSARSMARVDPW